MDRPVSMSHLRIAAFSEMCGNEIGGVLSGNCALLSVALARLFQGRVCSVQESDGIGFICHAALLYRGKLYDGGGATTRNAMRVWCDSPAKAVFCVGAPDDDFLQFAIRGTSCDTSYPEIEAAVIKLFSLC